MIINVRVDGRLVHGQVAMMWAPFLQISRIMVVGDEIADDELGKEALKLAKPSGTRLSILSVDRAIQNILAHRYDSQRVMIVTRELEALIRMKEAGVEFDEVNVGNVSNKAGKTTIYNSVFVNDMEVQQFRQLHDLGVKLIHRMTPQVDAADFMKALNEKFEA